MIGSTDYNLVSDISAYQWHDIETTFSEETRDSWPADLTISICWMDRSSNVHWKVWVLVLALAAEQPDIGRPAVEHDPHPHRRVAHEDHAPDARVSSVEEL